MTQPAMDAGGTPGDPPPAIEPTFEVEPNDDGLVAIGADDFGITSVGAPFTVDVLISGSLSVSGDEDVFAITNTTNAELAVQAQTFGTGGPGTCVGVDTVLRLRDAAGVVFVSNDDGGVEFCSLISRSIPAGGTLYLQVSDLGDDTPIPRYFLEIDFQ